MPNTPSSCFVFVGEDAGGGALRCTLRFSFFAANQPPDSSSSSCLFFIFFSRGGAAGYTNVYTMVFPSCFPEDGKHWEHGRGTICLGQRYKLCTGWFCKFSHVGFLLQSTVRTYIYVCVCLYTHTHTHRVWPAWQRAAEHCAAPYAFPSSQQTSPRTPPSPPFFFIIHLFLFISCFNQQKQTEARNARGGSGLYHILSYIDRYIYKCDLLSR